MTLFDAIDARVEALETVVGDLVRLAGPAVDRQYAQKCPQCGGSGAQPMQDGDVLSATTDATCRTCGGQGKVPGKWTIVALEILRESRPPRPAGPEHGRWHDPVASGPDRDRDGQGDDDNDRARDRNGS